MEEQVMQKVLIFKNKEDVICELFHHVMENLCSYASYCLRPWDLKHVFPASFPPLLVSCLCVCVCVRVLVHTPRLLTLLKLTLFWRPSGDGAGRRQWVAARRSHLTTRANSSHRFCLSAKPKLKKKKEKKLSQSWAMFLKTHKLSTLR